MRLDMPSLRMTRKEHLLSVFNTDRQQAMKAGQKDRSNAHRHCHLSGCGSVHHRMPLPRSTQPDTPSRPRSKVLGALTLQLENCNLVPKISNSRPRRGGCTFLRSASPRCDLSGQARASLAPELVFYVPPLDGDGRKDVGCRVSIRWMRCFKVASGWRLVSFVHD